LKNSTLGFIFVQTLDSNKRLNRTKEVFMRMSLLSALVPLLFVNISRAESIQLTEKTLVNLSLNKSPQWDSIEASYLSALSEAEQLNDRFRPEVFGSAQYEESREKPILEFIPIWTPLKTAQVGVRQQFRGGVGLTASIAADQRSAVTPQGRFDNISTNILRLDMQIDLWKDVFGRLSKAQSRSADYAKEKSLLEKDIQQKAFALSLRRTYWSLVANNEQLKIYANLKKIALEQVADAKKRLNVGITDAGELARYQAQVSSREGSLLYYQYQREILFKHLKNLLPEMQGKDIELAEYSIPKIVESVLSCTMIIAGNKTVPYEYTRYDEVVALLRKTQREQEKLASSYDDIDVKFIGSVRTTGVASRDNGNGVQVGSYGAAAEDWQENNRTGYAAGLQVTIPLGKESTRKTQELLAEKRFNADINQTESNIVTTHNQLVKVIRLLTQVIQAQKDNTTALEKRLEVQNKKFREARVTVNDLILDQDALLNSSLVTINTQLEIINTLFDYLVVFTETPCDFNRI
jgi:outer membrane protein TolC